MLLKRFYDDKLAQASYLVGCQATGEAMVIDPNRDADQYLLAAEAEGMHITHVTETHIHADFVSGSRELASLTGATMYLSAEGGPDWQYAFAESDGAVLVRDGDSFMVGNLKIEVIHTPGHTPEHLSFMLTDQPATDKPMGVFTGDFVFVGDVGRPDLLERAAKIAGTMEAGARTLFQSLQRFKQLPDYLQIWPAHGAGSACGKALGAVPSSTLGYERVANWGLLHEVEDEFVAAVLAGQPEPPKYFAQMKRINRDGADILGSIPTPPEVPVERIAPLIDRGTVVVDTRPAASFASGHIQGTLNIPLTNSFNTWAGWMIEYDKDIHLVVDQDLLAEAVTDLAKIGLDRVTGHSDAAAVERWLEGGAPRGTVSQIAAPQLAQMMERGEVAVLDVRGTSEYLEGHLPGVTHIPAGYLTDRLDELPRDRQLVLQCRSGHRSAIACSVLQAHGVDNVINLLGGYLDWTARGLPVTTEEPAAV